MTERVHTRLLCFPHAGAGRSSFTGWLPLFPETIRLDRIQLPGREGLAAQPPLRRVADAVEFVLPLVDRGERVALYGHSMGALVAFEVARALTAAGCEPVQLFVSGRRAPHLPARKAPVHRLPDEEFLAALARLGGGADPSPARRRHAIRLTRADLELSEEYRYLPVPRLRCPVTAFYGTEDPIVGIDEAQAWKELTDNDFAIHVMPGDHFFHQRHRAALATTMAEVLKH